jgi:hypothetical protein
MNNCVRVFYADDDDYKHHVDFPIYREFEDANDDVIREIAGESGWSKSNPTRVNVWLDELVAEKNKARTGAGTQMRRLIKHLKRFCRSRLDWDMPNGMKLTMLIAECFQFYEREDEAFYQLLVRLKNRLFWNLAIVNLADENYPQAKLTKTSQDQNVVDLRDRINDALVELAVLFKSDCKPEDARRAWDWVFQSDGFFKELEEKEKAEAKRQELLAKAALINSGRAATTTAGRIVTVGSVGVANAAHSFYGEDV